MSIAQLLQFYAPMAGLLGVVFWLGVLSNRVATLEREERDRKDREKLATDERDRIVRMETKMDAMEAKIDHLGREMAGMQRQLANIITGRSRIIEVPEMEG